MSLPKIGMVVSHQSQEVCSMVFYDSLYSTMFYTWHQYHCLKLMAEDFIQSAHMTGCMIPFFSNF